MAEPQLSVRSAKARDLARRLARREHRSIADVVDARSKLMKFARRGASRHPFSTHAWRTTMAAISIWRRSFAKTVRSIQDRSFDLPRHQRHPGDAAPDANPAVIAWLVRNDAVLALPTVTIAEIAFGIGRIRPDQRAARLKQAWPPGATVLPTGSSPSPKPPRWPMATS